MSRVKNINSNIDNKKLTLNLEVNNIGPHYGDKRISFVDGFNSSKVIFYALNGTGKTFISRVFQLASKDEDKKYNINSDDLISLRETEGSLFLKIKNNTTNEEKNLLIRLKKGVKPNVLNDSGYIFHVFNSDFVQQHIKPNTFTPDGNIEGYILGKTQIDLTEDKKREQEVLIMIKDKNKKIDEVIENARSELLEKGVHHSTKELALINKDKLLQENAPKDIKSFEDISNQLKLLGDLPEEIPDITIPTLFIKEINFTDILTILNTKYPKGEWDQEFASYVKNNRQFIEEGIKLTDHNHDNVCPFCKQHLKDETLELIQRYKTFLADKEARVLRMIEKHIEVINDVINNIKKYSYDIKTVEHKIDKLKKYFSSLENEKLIIHDYDEKSFECFNRLIKMLYEKHQDITITGFDAEETVEDCKKLIDILNRNHEKNIEVIKRVNKTKNDIKGERLKLRRELCLAQFKKVKNNLSTEFDELEKLNIELDDLRKKIQEKEKKARISKKEKVFETLEFFLNKFFAGKYKIDKETFHIKFFDENVGEKASKILSDGEKSVVAFCYYLALTHVLIDREEDYEKLFFIIDDPISSMDFHYVYAIAQSLRDIKSHFDIKQNVRIWVFTHNLEFLDIIIRNNIIDEAYLMRPGKIERLKRQSLLPYENHLKDIIEIVEGIQQPSHTTGNSIRHVLETVCKFENPENSLGNYVTEHKMLADNSCIYTLCQDLSHGGLRIQTPFSDDVIVEACKVVVDFLNIRYKGQIDAIKKVIRDN